MMNRWLLLVGALQGWALWVLWKARELKVWPSGDVSVERGLLYLALAVPLAFYLTQNIEGLSRERRRQILIGIGIVFALLGAYSGWAENAPQEIWYSAWRLFSGRPSDLFAAAILGFVAIPLWAHFDFSAKRWSYHALFETSWRNALLTGSSAVLTGVFWIVLFAGAMLMKSIGLNFVINLIDKPIFAIPVTGIIFAAAFALGLARFGMIVTLRRFWLSISSWLLPLLLAFSVMWSLALPFTGLELLFKTHNAGFVLLWFIALSVNFANAAYQDGKGEQPYARWLGRLLEYAWLSLLVLAGVAWWAMQLRIAQYGWTEDRVWGVFVLVLATLYTAGYSYSLRMRHGWLAHIGKTNIATALVMCAGLALLLSPLADARRIAVISQMSRLADGTVEADKIDYAYLRWQAGRYGKDALETLAAGIVHKDKDIIAAKAKQTLAQENRYSGESGIKALTPEQMRLRFRVLPKNAVLDEALLQALQDKTHWETQRCMAIDAQCLAWMIDLNGDGLKEAILITEKPEWQFGNAVFYRHLANGQYRFGGTINLRYGADKVQREKMISDIESGKAKTLAPRYNDLEIGGRRISVVETPCANSGCEE
jgi:hypothetical protein